MTVRQNSFGNMIEKIVNSMNDDLDRNLQEIGLSSKLFGIIMILLENEGLTQREIGEIAGLPGYMTTRKFDALEKKGLLLRKNHPSSRRSHIIFLTEKGRSYRESLPEIIKKVNSSALSALNEEESTQLLKLLKKVISH